MRVESPCPPTYDKPSAQTPLPTDAPRVTDVLDAEELVDVLQLLAEVPVVPTDAIVDAAEDENTASIPVFYFPETEETAIEELDPAYATWVEHCQQGYCC